MADEIKIIPSPSPAEPKDVQVLPSPAPAEPFDVPTYPSPGPAVPFDVKVYPDPAPGGTVDVPTSPDGPPIEPNDVPLLPDGPPADPFDVPLLPDGPPIAPFDVPLLPDGPPVTPFDVVTTPDGPPIDVFDVPTTPDDQPSVPFDVPTAPDGPPADVINVGTLLSSLPAEPFDVAITYSEPPLLLSGRPGETPTIEKIIAAVKGFDSRLGTFLSGLIDISPITVSGPGGGAMDPTILASWFRDYTNTVGIGGVGRFITEQAALYAMNPVVARVFDPLYFIKMMIPGSMGHIHTTIDTQAGLTSKVVAEVHDELLVIKARAADYAGPNVYGPGRTMNDGQDFTIDELVDISIEGGQHPFVTDENFQTGLSPVKKFDSSKYFNERSSDGSMQVSRAAQLSVLSNPSLQSRESALVASTFINGIVRVPISTHEDPDGAVYSDTQNPGELVDDDDTRVPLCFTDLRKDPVRNAYRSVYFRPLNLGFSKAITPEWSEGSAFGRVDPLVGYQRTSRTYSVSFELHAFAPEDLQTMYYKMVWLDSMCYPSYGSDSLMRSGPVIRLRIGDAVSTDSGGLPGVIKSLNFDFAEAMWELKKGMKVPRSFKVTVDFLALHEGPVGIMNGAFGVFQLPPGGNQANVDTTDQGGPSESREGMPRVFSILPGRFSRFGEPKR